MTHPNGPPEPLSVAWRASSMARRMNSSFFSAIFPYIAALRRKLH